MPDRYCVPVSLPGRDVPIKTAETHFISGNALKGSTPKGFKKAKDAEKYPGIISLLQVPTWILFSVLGLIFYWLGRRRRQLDVYEN